MNIGDFAQKYHMKVATNDANLNRKITGVYVCDLLSWVMSHAEKDNIWITVHTHINIIAVAVLTEVSCIIVPDSIEIEQNTINKANEEGIVILSTGLTAYQICCKANENGI